MTAYLETSQGSEREYLTIVADTAERITQHLLPKLKELRESAQAIRTSPDQYHATMASLDARMLIIELAHLLESIDPVYLSLKAESLSKLFEKAWGYADDKT